MSQKAIREFDGKLMLSRWLRSKNAPANFIWDRFFQVLPSTVLSHPPTKEEHQWLVQEKLVAKPDQLIKRRGKAGLIKLNAAWADAVEWISARRGKECKVEQVSGVLDHFLIEQFMPHKQEDEYYICIVAKRGGDEILFHHEGGVDIGDVDQKALRLVVPVGEQLSEDVILQKLLINVPAARKNDLAHFIRLLFEFSDQLHYSYLEINPLVVSGEGRITPLDMAAKIDETAKFEVGTLWGRVQFPPPFGRPLLPAEAFIQELDSKTGASLKLTVLNPHGRIWTMVAGGGASVIFADTVADLGFASELANYGEYSGAPDEEQTFLYAKTILELMLAQKHAQGKILIIGGGIANFTNVGETFKGIIRALTQFSAALIEHNVKIYVRRGGPNYQEGLDAMRNLAKQQDLFIEVFGPETHMTSIVPLALGMPIAHRVPKLVPEIPQAVKPTLLNPKASPSAKNQQRSVTAESKVDAPSSPSPSAEPAPATTTFATPKRESLKDNLNPSKEPESDTPAVPPQLNACDLFTNKTRAIIFGLQPQAVQNMLDFDFICGRQTYSVAAMVYPFTGNHYMKFYWKAKEVLIPVFETLSEALSKFPEVDVMVNFASCRSVLESTTDFLKYKQIRTVAIIAEGVPERHTRKIIRDAASKNVRIIGPATVGGLKPGCFRIGNTGGALDNVISSRLYRPGSIAYVARSGGMSNELNNIISHNSDGVYEGIAIGGDKYPGTTFIDHLLRYQDNPDVKMMVVLGEVGGVEEYEICKLIDSKRLTKPMVAWCIGTCSSLFPYEVQFGHAGACASGELETASAKNKALRGRGVIVPQSFDDFGQAINELYVKLVENGTIVMREEMQVPTVPVDYEWARKLGLIRKPAAFISSIVDDRGDELEYAGIKISEVLQSGLGVGGVLGLIWFRKRLPDYACRFIELVLMVTADHGPAVAGAHNTIVAARAGKDLISSLCSGLLTIGPRFGGALDGAAAKFSSAFDSGLSAEDFVNKMRRDKELIPGIGHRIKSLENPDMRVVIVKTFVKKHFPNSQILSYAEQVELITTKKKSNLILNVDGAIACAFVDLLRACGAFTLEEANDYVKMGCLNGLFVLGRSIGLIGHFIDQNRLKQPLYRHPAEDISYLTKDALVI